MTTKTDLVPIFYFKRVVTVLQLQNVSDLKTGNSNPKKQKQKEEDSFLLTEMFFNSWSLMHLWNSEMCVAHIRMYGAEILQFRQGRKGRQSIEQKVMTCIEKDNVLEKLGLGTLWIDLTPMIGGGGGHYH